MAGFYSTKSFGTTEDIPDYTGIGLSEKSLFEYGRVKTNKGIDRLEQSMRQILITPKGSRFFVPTFGSMLYSIIYEPNDFIISDLARLYAREAIEEWEPRVKIEDIQTDSGTDPQVLFMKIIYRVLSTNSLENFVYALNRNIREVR